MSSGTSPAGSAGKMERLVVRRSLSPAYYYFLQMFADANRIKLLIDRRVHDRRVVQGRTFQERRRADRRALPPPTWTEGDFVVVRSPDAA
jgi:hypothetical protein